MLDGKHALVTGGGTGIGLAIAKALADAGAQVTITGRRADVLEDMAGGGLHAQRMDVSEEASVVEGVAQAVAARGPVQICVANAGIAEGRSLRRTDMAFWRQVMAVNLDGAFLTIRECLPAMREAGWGRVIAISSMAGLKGLKGAAAYTASKHGMIGLIRALSEDHAGSEMTFNAICPGYVDTDIVARNTAAIAERAKMSEDQARALMIEANRHKRLIDPEEVAGSALWLCSETARSVNGQAIEIAGGQV